MGPVVQNLPQVSDENSFQSRRMQSQTKRIIFVGVWIMPSSISVEQSNSLRWTLDTAGVSNSKFTPHEIRLPIILRLRFVREESSEDCTSR